MKTIFTVVFFGIINMAIAQDEFFQPGSTIGGYGELHWNKANDADGNSTKNTMDFHRFIIYYGYNWTEKWSFKSEVELEHNYVADDHGELELEQAFVNYHAGNWGFQGGVILPTAGLLNEYHEPPLFLSVERPVYSKYIIPTTWFGNGFVFYGNHSGFNFRLALLEDLNGDGIVKDGHIRGGRGKGFKTTGESLTKNFSVSYTGINGLRVGGSFTMNEAPTSAIKAETIHTWEYTQTAGTETEDDSDDFWKWADKVKEIEGKDGGSIGVSLFEINAKYDANKIFAVLEYGKSDFKGNNANDFTDFSSSGYYLDMGYNIGDFVNTNKLIPWLRISNVSKNDDDVKKQTDYLRFGLTWWPINDVAFKTDFANVTTDGTTTTEFNLGIGYKF
jgi:hypothetical protein